jgi:hypothetical protein
MGYPKMFLLVRPRRPRFRWLMLLSTISSTPLQQRAINGQAPITISVEGSASKYQGILKTVSDERGIDFVYDGSLTYSSPRKSVERGSTSRNLGIGSDEEALRIEVHIGPLSRYFCLARGLVPRSLHLGSNTIIMQGGSVDA